ncbi:unnamed protein product [Prunus armeniaca]|uniref:Uncharacterized protein n=1 Tax=Prunus armeniaca TaxID=36596 RepID=A0A6J5UZL9_PRUAR|nr:unnamed protein product [Prunus armeniaca]
MPYDLHTYATGASVIMACKSTLGRKELVQQQVQVAKLAMIEAVVNAVFSGVQTGTVPPKLLVRAASAKSEQYLRGKVSQYEILPVVTPEDMQILLDLKRVQNWVGSMYIDRSSEENKGVILRMVTGAGINVYEGPLNLSPFAAP